MVNLTQRWRGAHPVARAELIATAWEVFSVLLFISALIPAAFTTPWPGALFAGGLLVSSVAARRLVASGRQGYFVAALMRVLGWLLAVTPLMSEAPARVLVAALGFGLMAGGIRRAVYRRICNPLPDEPTPARLGADLRTALAENATVAGIVGGHVLLLFNVAFLRTASKVVFRAWWEIILVLAILGTTVFTLAVVPFTTNVLAALTSGPDSDKQRLEMALADARRIPRRLYLTNFAAWLICVTIGVFYLQPGPQRWLWPDAVMQVGVGALFAWAVSFYQRGWHEDTVMPAVALLERWTAAAVEHQKVSLRARMVREFGLPLLFTLTLSLLASIALYRTLAEDLPLREDFGAVTALCACFVMLVLAAGGLLLRAARQLSEPLSVLASAADRVASGRLEAEVPPVRGPIEVEGLGESIERMRTALAQTIEELRRERASLETNVALRTAELEGALEELKRAQTALIQGERMALIGELVASVAHEIHNPLNAIAGSVSSLERVAGELSEMLAAYGDVEPMLPPSERAALQRRRGELDADGALADLAGVVKVVHSATRRSVEIVSNLKSFSRASAEPIPTDLHAGLSETLSLLRHRLECSGVEVIERYAALPEITCRAGEMNQVFMNLLTNAIQAVESRHGSAGGGRIEVRTCPEGDAGVMIAILDNGHGVPERLRQRIFDPFFSTKGPREGTGLGLSISREIMRRHGGSLSVTADGLDGGACFECRLPTTPAPASSARTGASPSGEELESLAVEAR